MIADALDRLGDEDDLERRGNRARVLHHVADQLAQHRGKRRVDLVVHGDDFGRGTCIKARKGIECKLEHFLRPSGGTGNIEVAHLRQPAVATGLNGLVGDLLDLVRNALQVVHDLGDREDHPQVDRRRLPLGDDLAALLVHVDLHLVDLQLVGANQVEDRGILVLLQHHDGARELRLDQPAHREHAAADRFHFGVELLVCVFRHHVLPAVSGR